MIIKVGRGESRPEEHLEQVSTVLLADEGPGVRVDVLDRLGIRNHKVLLLKNQVINHDRSQLKIAYSEEAMKFKHLPVLLLPLEAGFTSLFKVEVCEVSEKYIALLRAWDIRDRDAVTSAIVQGKEAYDCGHYNRMQEGGSRDAIEQDFGCHLGG